MLVVVIIPLYKAQQYLPDLFGSLFRYYGTKDWVTVVAIDDQSSDGTFEAVKRAYPWVDIITTDQNLGFAKANNVATNYAIQKYNPKFLCYLNQDTEVEEGFLEKIVSIMESYPWVGIVQPLLMMHPFEKGVMNCAGCKLHFLGYGYTIDEGKAYGAQGRGGAGELDIPYASGAAFLIRTEIVRKIGLFDPYYIAYHEDTDLSLRVQQLGYRVVLCPASRVAHKYTTPEQVKEKRQINHNAYYWIERNRFVLFAKFWTTRMLVLLFPAFVVNEFCVMVFSLFRGFWKERLRMYGWLFSHLADLRDMRNTNVRTREWERQLMGMLTSEIWHGNADSVVLGIANVFWKRYFAVVTRMML